MSYQKDYDKIYYIDDVHGWLHLLFYNSRSQAALYFDGFDFYYKATCSAIPHKFNELEYPVAQGIFTIESIKQRLLDATFIRLTNGDILRISIPMEKFFQQLRISELERDTKIGTPLGISSYEVELQQLNESDECEIIINDDSIPDIIPYVPPPLPDKPGLRFINFVSRVLRSLRESTHHDS